MGLPVLGENDKHISYICKFDQSDDTKLTSNIWQYAMCVFVDNVLQTGMVN